jgi:transcriptional regulator with XRE-family HTH domain
MLPFCDRCVRVPRDKYPPSHIRGIPVPHEPTTIGGHLRLRRLQLKILQSQAASKLGVSTVTMSRWERDAAYPTWPFQPLIAAYLGYDPFTNPAFGHPGGNKSQFVAILSSDAPENLGLQIVAECIKARKTRKEFARKLGISPKTVWNWQTGRRRPSRAVLKRVSKLLGYQEDE